MDKKKRLSIGFTEKELNQISNLSAKLILTPAQLIRQFVMKQIEESSIDELENTFNFSDCEDNIINAVCKSFQVQKSEIIRKTRKRYIVDARTCAAYIMRNHLGYGVVQISTVLRKHYSSIIHMVSTAEKLIEYDKQFKMRYEETVKLIYTFEQTNVENEMNKDNTIKVGSKTATGMSEPKDNDVDGLGKCDRCGDTENIVIAIVANSEDKICYECWNNPKPSNTAELERLRKVNGELVDAAEMAVTKRNVFLSVAYAKPISHSDFKMAEMELNAAFELIEQALATAKTKEG